jgi:isocitrate dehydrogenase kinase/phosphatase
LSHELLHRGENRKTLSKRQRELEAEATAYVVMRHFEIEHVASNYLATYNVDGQQLRESLETISNAVKHLIAVIEGNQQNTEAAETVASRGREEAAA